MEQLYNGFTLQLSQGAFPLSTDSIALAGFARLRKNARVLDLGSGCGTLGLLLCAKQHDCRVTGVELEAHCHDMALQNARRNQISSRLTSICADIRTVPSVLQPGSFTCCVSNPPYFAFGPASKTHSLARQENGCTLQSLFQAAAWALKYGGDFFLVHRPERLAEIFSCASAVGLEPKRLQLLRHRQNGPISLVLVCFRKGAKPGLIWEEAALEDENGSPTAYYKKIYHI